MTLPERQSGRPQASGQSLTGMASNSGAVQ
jgi:hypothetical protein